MIFMHIKRLPLKKLFVALSLFFVLIPSYGRGWQFFLGNATLSNFYQIISSDQDSQYLKVWWWMIFRDKQEASDGTRFDNGKLFYEVDCKNHRARLLYSVIYNEAEWVGQSRFNEDWEPGVPDTRYDSLIRAVCDKSPNYIFKPVEVDIKRELSSLRGNEDQSAIKESLAKAKWFLFSIHKYKIDEDNMVSIIFFDKASLRINKQYRQILHWTLSTNSSSVNPLAITKNKGELREYDCDKQCFRTLKIFSLNKMGQILSRSGVSECAPDRNPLAIDLLCGNETRVNPLPVSVDFRTIETIPEKWLVGIDE